MGTSFLSRIVAIVLSLVGATEAIAQGRGGGRSQGGLQTGNGGGQQNQQAMQQQIQQIGQRLQEGDKVLKEASEKADEVRQVWQKADADHKQTLRELVQAKKSAEEDAKNSPELKAAKEKLEGLRGELAEIRKKVIETLTSENAEYQKAQRSTKTRLPNKRPTAVSPCRRRHAKN